MTYRIGLIVGSLSSTSINRRLSRALVNLAPTDLEFFEISIGDLPLFNADLESALPEQVVRYKADVESADGLLIVSPEYNRSIPGVLKNALDWGSRPWGRNSFAGTPVAVTGASPGGIGTAVMQAAVRPVVAFLGMPQLASPEAYITFSDEVYGADGVVHNDGTREFLTAYMNSFAAFVTQNASAA